MNSRNFKLVEISWIDAEASEAGWSEDDPNAPLTLLKTYGILVRQDEHWVVHASTFDPDTNRYSEKAKIPIGMIKGIRIIEEVEIQLPERT